MKRNTLQYRCFFICFHEFTLTKTTRSQRDELFAKSDFHESIRLNAEVLYMRNNESCIQSRSRYLARRVNSTKRSLHIANAFLKRIGSCVVESKRYPKRAIEKRRRKKTLRLLLRIIHQLMTVPLRFIIIWTEAMTQTI